MECPSEAEADIDEMSTRKGIMMVIRSLPPRGLIGMVRCYQIALSPLLGRNCRFHPSCSEYFILAVEKYGRLSGVFRGVWRICRCNPFNAGGHDPP